MSPAEVGRRVADDIERHGHDPLDNAGTGLRVSTADVLQLLRSLDNGML